MGRMFLLIKAENKEAAMDRLRSEVCSDAPISGGFQISISVW